MKKMVSYDTPVLPGCPGEVWQVGFALRPLEAIESGPRYAATGVKASAWPAERLCACLLLRSESQFLPVGDHRVSAEPPPELEPTLRQTARPQRRQGIGSPFRLPSAGHASPPIDWL